MCLCIAKVSKKKTYETNQNRMTHWNFRFPQLKTTPFTISLLSFSVRSCKKKKKFKICFASSIVNWWIRAPAGVAVNWWRSHLMFIIFVLVSIASIEPPLGSPRYFVAFVFISQISSPSNIFDCILREIFYRYCHFVFICMYSTYGFLLQTDATR